MPGSVPPVADEREGLLAYLAHQRYLLRISGHGLTDEQARATSTSSALSIGGLIKHLGSVERGWIDIVLQRRSNSEDDYQVGFCMGPDETLAGLLARYDEVAVETVTVIGRI